MIKTKDVVAKGLEIYPVYSVCPLCGREGMQKVVVITESEKVKEALRARHSYYNHNSEPVGTILHNDTISKYYFKHSPLIGFRNYAVRFVCDKCNIMYAPDPLQEASVHREQDWGLYFRVNRPEEFPINPIKLKMAIGIKCDSCGEDVASPYYIEEYGNKIEHYCDISPNRCGPGRNTKGMKPTTFIKKLQKEEEEARKSIKPGYKCNICGFETTSKSEIEKHIKEKHRH
jgi:DNA-directed RNA polymerase subunit N (RpoN/RPB10)/rubredoxin